MVARLEPDEAHDAMRILPIGNHAIQEHYTRILEADA